MLCLVVQVYIQLVQVNIQVYIWVYVTLQIYDDISARSLGLYSQPPTTDAFALAREVSLFLFTQTVIVSIY